MKTYEEYLQIIKDREAEARAKKYAERLKREEAYKKEYPNEPFHGFIDLDAVIGKTTIDYSVEIMGMMMKDFLDALNELAKEKNVLRVNHMGACPDCNTYLAPPFDGWCPICKKQTIGKSRLEEKSET